MSSQGDDGIRGLRRDCPVCGSRDAGLFQVLDGREYLRCRVCRAVFLERSFLPTPDQEKARHLQHRNDPADPGYRAFLDRLATPLLARVGPNEEGLDYGCGPGPVLAEMLRQAGHRVKLFDPIFHPDISALERTYDFITCTEVVEHFHRPYDEFRRLDSLLRPGGLLGIMTCFQTEDRLFAGWHYRRDITHVVFYRPETFELIAEHLGWNCEIPSKDLVFLRKSAL